MIYIEMLNVCSSSWQKKRDAQKVHKNILEISGERDKMMNPFRSDRCLNLGRVMVEL